MSSTPMLSTDSLTVQRWEKTGWLNVGQQTALGRMFDKGAVYFPDELLGKDNKGGSLRYDYIGKMTGHPQGEGGTLDGNEKSIDLGYFDIVMNESRDAVLIPVSGIEPQRTKINMEKAAKDVLPNRAAELVDTGVFQQLAGVNPTSFSINGTTYSTTAQKLHVQGHNTPVEPSTGRVNRAAAAATDQDLAPTDKMTLQLIDYALELNAVSEQPIEPLSDGMFDLYLHPYCVTDLMIDTTSAIQWNAIELARLEAGLKNNFDNAPKFNNKLRVVGKYGNVNLLSHPRVAQGMRSDNSAVITTVRRNVLVGKNALTFASPYGGRPSDDDVPMKIIDQMKDYKKYKGLGFELLYGLKKCQPNNGLDIGCHVIGAYAAAHS